jgi:hypothetical protein
VADGRVEEGGKKLLEEVDKTRQALAKGDAGGATDHLRKLQQLVVERLADGEIDEAFAQQVLNGIDGVARSGGLQIQQEAPPKGKDKGKDKKN